MDEISAGVREQCSVTPRQGDTGLLVPGRPRSPISAAVGRLLRNRAGVIGLTGLTLLVLMALGAGIISPYDPLEQLAKGLLPPGRAHLLGTDELGRDLLSRIIFGARIPLLVGLVSVAVGSIPGIATGLVAGYCGRWIDDVIMRVCDALLAFPPIVLGVAVLAVLGPGVVNASIAVGIYSMPVFSRLVRASVLVEKEKDYVLAARTLGANDVRIMVTHILPNCLPPLLVQLALSMSFAALLEASLSFLGLGTQPPDPSWGSMLSRAQAYIRLSPWYGVFPGLALASLLISLNFLADALRDVFDPRRAGLD